MSAVKVAARHEDAKLAELRQVAQVDEGPWKRVPNRADRRRWGIRGWAPLEGAFRRPRTRPIRGIDPTSSSRPSDRLHGRGRHGQKRAQAALRTAEAQRAALAQLEAGALTHGYPTPHDLKEIA